MIDIAAVKEMKQIDAGMDPHGIIVSINGETIYTTVSGEDQVFTFDRAANEVIEKIDVDTFPFFISI